MSQQIVDLKCPHCGAAVTSEQKDCIFCHQPIIITTFNSVLTMPMPEVNKYANTYRKEVVDNPESQELNNSLAMCCLKLKLYDKAIAAFEQAIENDFNNPETFFYAAVSLLRGKKAFLTSRADIDKAIEYLDAAAMIEPRGIYYYFLAYIKYDHFERKYLNTTPNFEECLEEAEQYGVSDYDIGMLFSILGVPEPDCF